MGIQLEEFLEKRKNKPSFISPAITDIHERTVRVIKNKVAGEKEFISKRGKYYPKGSLYHIHFTNDKQTYYMTGGEHHEKTKLIFRTNVFDNDFDYYNILNKQENLEIKSTATLPTKKDYRNGKMTRYFAKKSNEVSSPVFEVSVDDFNSSPLYTFVSLEWSISGDKEEVLKENRISITIASKKIPNISKLIPDYQYYRADTILSARQSIVDRLGITGEQSENQQETTTTTQTTTTPKNNTQQNVPSGVPSDVYTSGAGGGSY